MFDREEQNLEVGSAKRGCKAERDQALELHETLRNYTYHLIGLGNCFRRIARDFSGRDGSNWRYNRHLSTDRLKALADRLYSMDPYDTQAIFEVEKELEVIALELSKKVA